MAWQEYTTFKQGDMVVTPFGKGQVRAISSNGTAQVRMEGNGQLMEVPTSQMQKGDSKEQGEKMEGMFRDDYKEQSGGSNGGSQEGQEVEFKAGDKVTDKNTGEKMEVVSVTQRSVYTQKLNEKGEKEKGRKMYEKKTAGDQLEKEGGNQQDKPAPTPEETADALYGILQLKDSLEKKIDKEIDAELKPLREAVKANQKLEVKIGEKTNVVTGKRHKQFETLVTYAGLRLATLGVS